LDPLIIVFGLGVGILVGLTGIGGGSLMTPLLIIAGGYSPVVAIGTDLAYGAITKKVGGVKCWRDGLVDMRLSWWLAGGSIPGSLLGVFAIDRLETTYGDDFEPYLLVAVAVALALAAVGTLTRALFMPELVAQERDAAVLKRTRAKRGTVAIGFVLGFILGLTSVGSGALIGLVLIFLYRLRPQRVVGTDVFHAAVLLWAAGLAHWVGGNVDFVLMGNILIGSIPGILVGTAMLKRVPTNGLRPALGVVLLGAALGVLAKAGVNVPAYVLVGIPAMAGVASWRLHHRRVAHRGAAALGVNPNTSST
jgi:uncharacterized membrane protein YfcA